jgi:uncharacterized protein (TIGR02231 family)
MTSIVSQVVEVTVFPDRARVTRRGSLSFEPGVHQVEFGELPLAMQTESVRASGRGTPAALLGVDTRRTYFTDTPVAAVQELEKQIEALTDKDKALADQSAAAEVQAQFVKKLADQAAEQLARGLALGRSDISQSSSLIAFTRQQLAEAQQSLREIGLQRRELARQLAKLNAELNTYRSTRPRERYLAVVEVDVQQAGELSVDLTYMVSGAGWNPLYDLRATGTESDAAALQISYLAQVTQNSGEDWVDSSMTLSTARPALTSIRPELDPWYLDAYAPPPRVHMRAASAMASGVMAPSPALMSPGFAESPRQVVMVQQQAEVSSEGASVTFKLAQSVSIPSDGTPHKVTVSTLELKPRLDYICIAKLAEAAYRRARVTNSTDYLLLPGAANLFVEGDFVGSFAMNKVAPREEFELTLGVDDRIFVKRELKAQSVDKTFIGDRRRMRFGYEIEFRNLRTTKVDIELHDQLPVARHEQIKVKLESTDPKPSDQSELSELTWKLSLVPNDKRLIRFDFTIEHPVTMTVSGLPEEG